MKKIWTNRSKCRARIWIGDWGEDEGEGEYEPEDPLYAQLRREEKEVEKESDIWNEE